MLSCHPVGQSRREKATMEAPYCCFMHEKTHLFKTACLALGLWLNKVIYTKKMNLLQLLANLE